jgi:hypothetical protein
VYVLGLILSEKQKIGHKNELHVAGVFSLFGDFY